MNELVFKERSILGASCYKDDHPTVMHALGSGLIRLDDFISAVIPLEDLVDKGFRELLENNENRASLLLSSLAYRARG